MNIQAACPICRKPLEQTLFPSGLIVESKGSSGRGFGVECSSCGIRATLEFRGPSSSAAGGAYDQWLEWAGWLEDQFNQALQGFEHDG